MNENQNSRLQAEKSHDPRCHGSFSLLNKREAENSEKARRPKKVSGAARPASTLECVGDKQRWFLGRHVILPVAGGALGLTLFFVLTFAWQPNPSTGEEESLVGNHAIHGSVLASAKTDIASPLSVDNVYFERS